jgi:hypothetical protein
MQDDLDGNNDEAKRNGCLHAGEQACRPSGGTGLGSLARTGNAITGRDGNVGLNHPLSQLRFERTSPAPGVPAAAAVVDEARREHGIFFVHDLEAPPGHAASLCLATASPAVTCFRQ